MPLSWYEILFLSVYCCLTLVLIILKLCKIGAKRRGVVKMLASLSFVAVCVYGTVIHGGLAVLLSVGVCFASLGDFLLIFRKKHVCFVAAVISFSVASTIISIYSVLTYGWRWWSIPIFVLFMLFVILGQYFKLFGFGRNKICLNIYTLAVGVCGSLGFSLIFPSQYVAQVVFGIGCFCYLISDICLGLFLYKFRNRFVDAINTLLYFPGMLLISLSLLM